MEISTAVWIALVLWLALFVPYAIYYIRTGQGARTHLVHVVEAAGSLRHRPGRWDSDRLDRAQTMRGGLVTE